MIYDNYEIGHIYLGKDGRMRIYITDKSTHSHKVMSYPKYLIESHQNRFLLDEETIDHIDGNCLNNELSNLRVLPRYNHCYQDTIRLKQREFVCPFCNNTFILSGKRLHNAINNRRKGRSGPFCNRKCAGKYSKELQLGLRNRSCVKEIIPEYHKFRDSN